VHCNIPDIWNKISKYFIHEFVENIIDRQRKKGRGRGREMEKIQM
jgi:hypothetical protein